MDEQYNFVRVSLELLKGGGLLCYPSDTIWGLGCDATNKQAVERLIQIKGRDWDKGFVVLVGSVDSLYSIVEAARFGPSLELALKIEVDSLLSANEAITMVFPSIAADLFAPGVARPDGSLAIRVVQRNGFCRDLVSGCDIHLISTSANYSHEKPVSMGSQLGDNIKNHVDLVLPDNLHTSIECGPSKIVRFEISDDNLLTTMVLRD